MKTYTVDRRPERDQQWCPFCTGSGKLRLPGNITGPNMVDLVYRYMYCPQCQGTGVVQKPPAALEADTSGEV